MMDLMVLCLLSAGFYVGWNIGANDAANTIGTTVGGGVMSYRRALLILVPCVVFGAYFGGWKVTRTVGEGLLTSAGPNPLIDFPQLAIAALCATGLWVTLATILGLPVSTSQSIVGSVLGAGLVLSLFRPEVGAQIQTGMVFGVVGCWLLAPLASALLAFSLFHLLQPLVRAVKDVISLNRAFALLLVITSAVMACAHGANDGGAVAGAVYVALGMGGGDIGILRISGLFVGIAIATGAATFSRRVIHTVGLGITRLDPQTAFVAQFAAAATVLFFVGLGIPVSTTQAIVGAVVGVGLTRGIWAVNVRRTKSVALAWVATPFVGCLFSVLIGALLLGI